MAMQLNLSPASSSASEDFDLLPKPLCIRKSSNETQMIPPRNEIIVKRKRSTVRLATPREQGISRIVPQRQSSLKLRSHINVVGRDGRNMQAALDHVYDCPYPPDPNRPRSHQRVVSKHRILNRLASGFAANCEPLKPLQENKRQPMHSTELPPMQESQSPLDVIAVSRPLQAAHISLSNTVARDRTSRHRASKEMDVSRQHRTAIASVPNLRQGSGLKLGAGPHCLHEHPCDTHRPSPIVVPHGHPTASQELPRLLNSQSTYQRTDKLRTNPPAGSRKSSSDIGPGAYNPDLLVVVEGRMEFFPHVQEDAPGWRTRLIQNLTAALLDEGIVASNICIECVERTDQRAKDPDTGCSIHMMAEHY